MRWPPADRPAVSALSTLGGGDAPTRRRRQQLGTLALGVLAVHLWLIGPLERQDHPVAPRAAPIEVVALLTAPAKAAPAPPVMTPDGAAPTETTPAAAAPDTPLPPRVAGPERPDAGDAAPDAPAGNGPTGASDGTSEPAPPTPQAVASTIDDGGPPPVYTTRVPRQPLRLHYRLERGGESGRALLSYDPLSDTQYRARLTSQLPPAAQQRRERVLVDWASEGGFDAAGLAPLRMTERSRGREVRAVNFQRDKRFISFSGSSTALALFDGAQDRLSLLLQLMAIGEGQAQPLQPGQSIRLQLANNRGQADIWSFTVEDLPDLQVGGRQVPTVYLVRQPDRAYDLRMEVWLARESQHLPVQLRLTQVPRGTSETYTLQDKLGASPRQAP